MTSSPFKSVHLSPSIMSWGTGVSVYPFVFSCVWHLQTLHIMGFKRTFESQRIKSCFNCSFFKQHCCHFSLCLFKEHQRNFTLLGKAIYLLLYRRVCLIVPWLPLLENLILHRASLSHSSSTSLPQLPEGALISFSRPHLCHLCKKLEWGKTDIKMEGMMQEELKRKV